MEMMNIKAGRIKYNSMKIYILAGVLLLNCLCGYAKDTLQVCSPSGKICVKVWMGKQLNYYISYENTKILNVSSIGMELDNNKSLALNNTIRSSSVKNIKEQITSPVPEKRKIIPDVYTLLSINFKQPYKV